MHRDPCPAPQLFHPRNRTKHICSPCGNKAVLAFGSPPQARCYGHNPCSPREKCPLNFLPKANPAGVSLPGGIQACRKSSWCQLPGRFCRSCLESGEQLRVLSLSLRSLSRVASLLSTVGWQGRRDFFFSPFSFTPPTPFWEAVSAAVGSC